MEINGKKRIIIEKIIYRLATNFDVLESVRVLIGFATMDVNVSTSRYYGHLLTIDMYTVYSVPTSQDQSMIKY